MSLNQLDDNIPLKGGIKSIISRKLVLNIIDQYLDIINMNEDEIDGVTEEMCTEAIYKLNLIMKSYYYSGVFTFRDLLTYCEIFKSLELSLGDWIQDENNQNISAELEEAYLNGE